MNQFRAGIPLLFLAVIIMACNEQIPQEPSQGEEDPILEKATPTEPGTESAPRFQAVLSGGENVPPTPSTATGVARFRLNAGDTSITFKVFVRDLADIMFSHIHMAPVGVNGEVVVRLYDGPTIPGPFTGVFAQGTITAEDLEGPLAGQPLSGLIAKMNADSTYVNVHTLTFPSGEIGRQVAAF